MRGDGQREEWVVVAEFGAFDSGVAADLAVAKLQNNGIPAVRFPSGKITSVVGPLAAVEPIRVVVPPEDEDGAREILSEEFDDEVLENE